MTTAWLRPRLWFAQILGVALWCVWLGSLASGGWKRDHSGQLFAADHIAFYTDIDVNCMVEQGVAAVPAMVEGTCATQL